MSCIDTSNDRYKPKAIETALAWSLTHDDHEPAIVRGVLEFADEQTLFNLEHDYPETVFLGGILERNGMRYSVIAQTGRTLTVEVA